MMRFPVMLELWEMQSNHFTAIAPRFHFWPRMVAPDRVPVLWIKIELKIHIYAELNCFENRNCFLHLKLCSYAKVKLFWNGTNFLYAKTDFVWNEKLFFDIETVLTLKLNCFNIETVFDILTVCKQKTILILKLKLFKLELFD